MKELKDKGAFLSKFSCFSLVMFAIQLDIMFYDIGLVISCWIEAFAAVQKNE